MLTEEPICEKCGPYVYGCEHVKRQREPMTIIDQLRADLAKAQGELERLTKVLEKLRDGADTGCKDCDWYGGENELCEANGLDQCPKCGSTELEDRDAEEIARQALFGSTHTPEASSPVEG